MKYLKLIARFFTRLFLKLTPAGRKKLMYDKALDNMKETHIVTTLEKRITKSEINFYVRKVLKRRKVSDHHISMLVHSKFGKAMQAGNLKWNPKTYTVVDA